MNCFELLINLDVLSVVSPDWGNVLNEIKVSSMQGNKTIFKKISGKKIQWQIRPIYPFCQPIDLLEYFGTQLKPRQIIFYFNDGKTMEGTSMMLYVIERNTALRRRLLKSNMLSYNGPDIKMTDLYHDSKLFKVGFRLSQSLFIENDDEEISCVNYPTKKYQNYKECDEDFMTKEIDNLYGIKPFWAAENMSDVTLNK